MMDHWVGDTIQGLICEYPQSFARVIQVGFIDTMGLRGYGVDYVGGGLQLN
jgi:hypothetical protein